MKIGTPVRRLVGRTRQWKAERELGPTARQVRARNLTYLRPERLRALELCATEVNRQGVDGDFVECGVALGGSAVLLAECMGEGRTFHGYDVFGMIPAPTENDPPEVHQRFAVIASGQSQGIGDETYYGYRDDLLDHVAATLAEFGHEVGERVQLHPGLFEETLHPAATVAVAHVDCDWYDPVQICLERLTPRLAAGGYLVLDDYFDYGGCQLATDDFLERHPEFELVRFRSNVAVRLKLGARSSTAPRTQ